MEFRRPRILISKCLEFDACRYDGKMISNVYINTLKNYVDFITVCPEVEIGLGVPRDPIHLIKTKNKLTLFQPSTKSDLGAKMKSFSKEFMGSINYLDGIIFKLIMIKLLMTGVCQVVKLLFTQVC